MQVKRSLIGAVVGIGLIAGSIASAEARPRGWGDRGWHRHRDNGFNFGDVIGIAALIGAVAVVANSMSKDRAARPDRTDDYRPDDYRSEDYRNADPDTVPPADSSAAAGLPNAPDGIDDDFSDVAAADRGDAMPIAGEDRAVEACAIAAREEATRSGGYAEVRRIDAPQPVQGGYNIDGEVERRASWRDSAGETRRFTCSVQGDQVADVYLSRDLVSN
ncbi:hypothetical protein [Sphingobium algorifonticola]|uniref:Uncharacterized protein n=1 Tax=Sphingobium algorifonticola TaxID=2008318 RepID=A0A437J7G5_9SPHN|nr:hypothetical protein [Sphingobium algorifonticola]RVT41123.1 hypothetical protein ENE74_11860 [Sphingobium algorifonticola]